MTDYTDPLTDLARGVPGEMATSSQWNSYALNNVEAMGTMVADTVIDLEERWGGGSGAQRSGRFGYIRTGSSLFDFIHVVYDDTIDRWVSQTFAYGTTGERPSETAGGDNITYVLRRSQAGGSSYWGPLIPYQSFDAAGLNLQVRWLWVASNDSSSTWSIIRLVQGIDIGDAFSSVGTQYSQSTGTQNTPTLQGDSETAWTFFVPTVSDYICPGIRLATTGTTVSTLWQVTFLWRWVSA